MTAARHGKSIGSQPTHGSKRDADPPAQRQSQQHQQGRAAEQTGSPGLADAGPWRCRRCSDRSSPPKQYTMTKGYWRWKDLPPRSPRRAEPLPGYKRRETSASPDNSSGQSSSGSEQGGGALPAAADAVQLATAHRCPTAFCASADTASKPDSGTCNITLPAMNTTNNSSAGRSSSPESRSEQRQQRQIPPDSTRPCHQCRQRRDAGAVFERAGRPRSRVSLRVAPRDRRSMYNGGRSRSRTGRAGRKRA